MSDLLADLKAMRRARWIRRVLREHKLLRLCEIGVRQGKGLRRLRRARPEILVGVDCWLADGDLAHNDLSFSQAALDAMYRKACAMMVEIPALRILRMYSHEAALCFPDGFFDYVYIDADHTYAAVCQDIATWYPKVRSGGILAGHDFLHHTVPQTGVAFGVVEAVTEFVPANNLQERFHKTTDRFASWYVVKP